MDVTFGSSRAPYVCRNVWSGWGGQPEFINVRASSGRGQGKSYGLAEGTKAHEIHTNVTELPLAQSPRGRKTKGGNVCMFFSDEDDEDGYGEVAQRKRRLQRARMGRRGRRGRRDEDADVRWRKEARGNTTGYCLETERQRTGQEPRETLPRTSHQGSRARIHAMTFQEWPPDGGRVEALNWYRWWPALTNEAILKGDY